MQLPKIAAVRRLVPAVLVGAFVAAPLAAQGGKVARSGSSSGAADVRSLDMPAPAAGWREFDKFQDVLKSSWSSPGKVNTGKASDLAKAARSWSNSEAPAQCNSPSIRLGITKIKTETQEYASMVSAKAEEAVLQGKLTEVQDAFETVTKECKLVK